METLSLDHSPTQTHSRLRMAVGFFDNLPVELIIMIADALNPADLYTFICTSKYFKDLIMARIDHFANLYANVLILDVERFMWSLFDFEYLLITDKERKFLRMLGVHKFTQTNKLEIEWNTNDMDDNDEYGPLPTDPTELYIKKFQTGMIHGFGENYSIYLSGMHVYSTNNESFRFLFKILIKYRKAAGWWCETIEYDMRNFQERGITFEMFDEYFQEALSFGAKDFDIYYMISNDFHNDYLRLLRNGIVPQEAKYDVEDDDYSDELLETYNAIRHIIGNHLAHHYILDERININHTPNFLENVSKLYANGILNEDLVDLFLTNPTDEMLENILLQVQERILFLPDEMVENILLQEENFSQVNNI